MKSLIAVIGGSALVAMGAVTIAITQQQAQPTRMMSSSSTMNIGATSTMGTPPSVPATSVAAPTVKAGSK
jgi:hypothetical protein